MFSLNGETVRQTRTGRTPCKAEGGDGVTRLQAKEHERLSANHEELGERSGADAPSEPQKGPTLVTPRPWAFSRQNCETERFCCSSHSVWCTLLGSPRRWIQCLLLVVVTWFHNSAGPLFLLWSFLSLLLHSLLSCQAAFQHSPEASSLSFHGLPVGRGLPWQ